MAPAIAVLFACAPAVAQQESGYPIGQKDAEIIQACVKQEYSQMQNSSRSACRTPERYYAAKGGDHVRVKIPYPAPQNYKYVSGSGTAVQTSGSCEHNLYVNWMSEAQFQCEWETSGCGQFKEGGHVKGYCTMDMVYVPQSGDLRKIKEYCVASVIGGTATKPPISSVACSFN
ncbi:hypothetical protein GCM10010994_32060 [Chelatococcus reniformis]|uniref:Uncharacterized protein n=1 Tax=Chelatococcus reniformis TaxID=1494448 RepID=A0A916XG69_9HYPH|nr:hypothetical protein GCM10010994_32060 [Chelatococcus reniformis]